MPTETQTIEILKQDRRGRVRTPVERREALLDEFEKSGVSGAEFARLAGLKYSSFQNWVQRRRRRRVEVGVPNGVGELAAAAASPARLERGPVRLFEALVENGACGPGLVEASRGVAIDLPGGARLLLESRGHLELVAELLRVLARTAAPSALRSC
jgi:hypothetical protein